MEVLETGVSAEIKDAERTMSLTEEKCAGITQRIPEMIELEKTEKDRVIDIVHILMLKVFFFFKRSSQQYTQVVKLTIFYPFIPDFAIEASN